MRNSRERMLFVLSELLRGGLARGIAHVPWHVPRHLVYLPAWHQYIRLAFVWR